MILLMIFLKSFILCGMICAIFQLVLMLTKLDMIKLLVSATLFGALLYAAGLMPILANWGGNSINVFILGYGSIICNGAMIGATGNMAAWLGILGSIALVTALALLLGVIAALLHMKLYPPKKQCGHQDINLAPNSHN